MERTRAVIALGMFDGVHIGHRELIRRCTALAQRQNAMPAVYTFLNHPETVLRNTPPHSLTDSAVRRALLMSLGVREVRMDSFTPALAALLPEEFIDRLASYWEISGLVVGYNYSFGRFGAGTPETLLAIGARRGFPVEVVPAVLFDGAPVSSTRIRALLDAGDVTAAAALLGAPYTLSGTVGANRGIGRTIGFPTANLPVDFERALPLDGVYATDAQAEGGCWRAVTNIGTNPTVHGTARTLETHLIGFSGDLYGKALSVAFLARIRGEERFDSLEALSAQIARDRADALAWEKPKI